MLRGCDDHAVMVHFKAPQNVPLRLSPAVLYCFRTFQVQVVLSNEQSESSDNNAEAVFLPQ